MSWEVELPIIVRTLISDLGSPPLYSDARLLQVLAVSAKYVQFDVVLDHKYDVSVTNSTISPDPTIDNDDIFVSLVCLKAACLMDQSSIRTKAAMEGIRASLGPASLSVGGSLAGLKMIIDHGPCALYEELTSHWDVANASAIRAILSPFVGNKFDPRAMNTDGFARLRDFYT